MTDTASLTDHLIAALRHDRLCAVVTVIGGESLGQKLLVFPEGETFGDLGPEDLRRAATESARAAMRGDAAGPVALSAAGREIEAFVEVHAPAPVLVVVGAVHVAIHLVTYARELGMRTVVVDPRSAFATRERFPHADELRLEWPADAIGAMALHESTYFAFLSHDPKLDLPGLELALRSRARYIGALGSSKTHQKRLGALRERGFSDRELERIHAPIGLKLGGRRPEEIALGIAAQLLSARYGGA